MNYAKIIPHDIANGEGVRTSLFVSGCHFHCPGCFNQEAQDFAYGKPYTKETEQQILSYVQEPMVAGLSILGGDPLWQSFPDIQMLVDLCYKVQCLRKTVWLWTGFTWEDFVNPQEIKTRDFAPVFYRFEWGLYARHLVSQCNVVVDGPFMQDKQDLTLKWRGSSNQRVIDVKKTMEAGYVVELESADKGGEPHA